MEQGTDPSAVTRVHVDGWAVVRVARPLDHDLAADVEAACREEHDAGLPVVVDLRHHPVAPSDQQVLLDLSETCGITIVAADAPTRSALLAAGAQAHASLDGALANTAPVLRRASEGEPSRHVAPAATDSVLVTAEDIARSPGGADPR